MLGTAKRIVNAALKVIGAEIVRLDSDGIEAGNSQFNFKELQSIRAIGAGGTLSLDESRFLGELVGRIRGLGPIVEVGTLFGWSTRVIVLHKEEKQKLYTVDNYSWNSLGLSPEAHFLATQRVLGDAIAHHNVIQVRADKNAFYENYRDEPPALL